MIKKINNEPTVPGWYVWLFELEFFNIMMQLSFW